MGNEEWAVESYAHGSWGGLAGVAGDHRHDHSADP